MFEKFRVNSAKARLLEEKLYAQVVEEVAQGYRRDGLWAKAQQESDGSLDKTKSIYIKLRVQSIKDEMEIEADEISMEFHRKNFEEEDRKKAEKESKFREFKNILKKKGYKLTKLRRGDGRFFVDEPLGGRHHINSWEELEEYVKNRK
tara:strand:- start:240 stop:683 length:444 start_codon:yes stop_codon:yes gene_type:complete